MRWRFLAHNVLVHPVAGVLWFLGFDQFAERVHAIWAPPG